MTYSCRVNNVILASDKDEKEVRDRICHKKERMRYKRWTMRSWNSKREWQQV